MTARHYDLIIIGGGPAGLTAGLYAARARLKVLLIEKAAQGGQILVTDWIENYPGFPEGISGFDLAQKISDQAGRFDLETMTADVQSIEISGEVKTVILNDATITSSALIIASGASPRKLGIPGEDQFFGKGLSTCATCDAPFYKDRVVAAIGGGDTAVQESIYLTKFAKKVYLIHRRDELRATKILQERALANEKIEMLWNTVPTRFSGLFNVDSVVMKNVKTGEAGDLKVDGCFVWVGVLPNTGFLNNSVIVDDAGFIAVNARMETSVPGVYAVGDVRDTPLRQIASAVGDAAIAAFSAGHYVENLNK
ncbi:MAG: thioredoxin-disulfide reductase [Desulfobacterales bacterium]|nr:thioredoxin-disulfide reductase [Desulfobacterales bacterium]